MKFKHIISILLAIVLALSFTPIIALAAEAEQQADSAEMQEIAEETIAQEPQGDDVILYKNLDGFVEKVRADFPQTADLDIAKFILDYTHKDYTNFTDDMILETLEYQETYVSQNYLKVTEEGETEYLTEEEMEETLQEETNEPQTRATWTSSNGYMRITTTASLNKTSGNKKYYIIEGKAKWLKMPTCYFEDVFVLANNATFDDSYTGTGYLSEKLSCCLSSKDYKYTTNTNSSGNSTIAFDYFVNSAGLRINLFKNSKYTCSRATGSHTKFVSGIETYIKYRIIVNKGTSKNVAAAYCHKEVSLGNIGVGIGVGSVSVSFTLGGFKSDYKAKPITINA